VHSKAGELEDSAFRARLARDREKREYSTYCDPFGELTLSLAARLMNLISTQTVQSVETADALLRLDITAKQQLLTDSYSSPANSP
jgi:hypothetical protein